METDMKAARPGLEAHLGYWLRRVSNQVSGRFVRALQAEGVSVAEWVVLCLLQERAGMTPTGLAEATAMTRGAVSKVVEKLESKGCVCRAAHPGDNRIQRLSLTRKGAGRLPRLAALADRNDDRFFGCLDPGEKAALRRLLEKLTDHHQLRGAPTE
jgi:DNA-binding MarR family transcriptional regulator